MIKSGTAYALVLALSGVAAGAADCGGASPGEPASTPQGVTGVVESVFSPSVPLTNGRKCASTTKRFAVRLYGDDGVAGTEDPVVDWCMDASTAAGYKSGDQYPKG